MIRRVTAFALFAIAGWCAADDVEQQTDQPQAAIFEQLSALEDVNEAEWGIRNGCINLRHVGNFDFRDDRHAVVTMKSGKKKILMTLRRSCQGIRHDGFVISTRTNQLCERFDSVTAMWGGAVCNIESFQPVVMLEDQDSPDDDETNQGDTAEASGVGSDNQAAVIPE